MHKKDYISNEEEKEDEQKKSGSQQSVGPTEGIAKNMKNGEGGREERSDDNEAVEGPGEQVHRLDGCLFCIVSHSLALAQVQWPRMSQGIILSLPEGKVV